MRRFTVLVIAFVLAPELQSAVVAPSDITTFPILIAPETRPLPAPEETVPELRPLPPPVEAVVPELISINPCDACFAYLNDLIGQLTGIPELDVEPEVPQLPEFVPEVPEIPEISRPLPESVPEDLRPLPLPVQPETEINPIPMPVVPEVGVVPGPSEAEAEVELAVQGIPLPEYIIR